MWVVNNRLKYLMLFWMESGCLSPEKGHFLFRIISSRVCKKYNIDSDIDYVLELWRRFPGKAAVHDNTKELFDVKRELIKTLILEEIAKNGEQKAKVSDTTSA